jgi:hypothetical protein
MFLIHKRSAHLQFPSEVTHQKRAPLSEFPSSVLAPPGLPTTFAPSTPPSNYNLSLATLPHERRKNAVRIDGTISKLQSSSSPIISSAWQRRREEKKEQAKNADLDYKSVPCSSLTSPGYSYMNFIFTTALATLALVYRTTPLLVIFIHHTPMSPLGI